MSPGKPSMQALGLANPSARVRHLLTEHERLRSKVMRKRRELDRFETELREVAGALSGCARPLIDEALKLDAAIHASFAHILREKKLSKRARSDIRSIYQSLQVDGTITPRLEGAEARETGARPGPCGRADCPNCSQMGAGAEAYPGTEPEENADFQSATSAHQGRAVHLRDLRKAFLTLADAIHPDKVQSDEEKLARTEAMKELNRAYREGDMAKILELERAWNLEGKLDPGGGDDDVERRCQSIERKNGLLAEQLRGLSKTLRALRRTEQGSIVIEVRRLRRERHPDPISQVLVPLEHEINTLRHLAKFVQEFQNGEMSLERFLEGPQLRRPGDEDLGDIDDLDERELDELMAYAMEMLQSRIMDMDMDMERQGRSRKKRRRRGQ